MLKKLQEEFYNNIILPNTFENYENSQNFSAENLTQIYHHQYFTTLIDSLIKTYSCINRLVGEEFFKMLALQFIKENPSQSGSIIDYGNGFSEFLANNQHCKNMPFLTDVAKFECIYELCYFHSNTYYFKSKYPIIAIWQMDERSENIDLDSGGDNLKIYKKDFEVLVEKIKE